MEYTELITSVGFPIAMVVWFMFRTEKVIGANTIALNNIAQTINKCKGVK